MLSRSIYFSLMPDAAISLRRAITPCLMRHASRHVFAVATPLRGLRAAILRALLIAARLTYAMPLFSFSAVTPEAPDNGLLTPLRCFRCLLMVFRRYIHFHFMQHVLRRQAYSSAAQRRRAGIRASRHAPRFMMPWR